MYKRQLWLTGCGGAAAPAAPAGSGTAAQSTADTAVQTAHKDRIPEQFTLEKTIQLYEWGLSLIHISEESLPIWEEPSAFFSLYSSGPVL